MTLIWRCIFNNHNTFSIFLWSIKELVPSRDNFQVGTKVHSVHSCALHIAIVLHFSQSLLIMLMLEREDEPGLPQCDEAPVRACVGEPREQLELGVEVRLPPAGARGRGRGRGGVGGGELYPHLIISALPCIPRLAILQIQRSHFHQTY